MTDKFEELDGYLLTEDEIEFYLKGDRRDIDKLLLTSNNRLTALIVPHALKEDKRDEAWTKSIERLGGIEKIEERAAYVDALLDKSRARAAAWRKIAESTAFWALVIVVGFICRAVWDTAVAAIRSKVS